MRRALILVFATTLSAAQTAAPSPDAARRSGYENSARATLIHTADVYVSPDETSQRIATVLPGHEVVILEKSGPWARVYANTDTEPSAEDVPLMQQDQPATVTSGWIHAHGIVDAHTTGGDAILYGTAATLEQQAAAPHPPTYAADSAHRLYRRIPDYFPASPLAAESAWRAADIRWQLEKADISTLPSASERESFLRPQLYEADLKSILKKYPQSQWAALAAFDLIDNQLCGDWQGLAECPEKESSYYEHYADQYPDGPRTAQALYAAAWRQGSLVDIYAAAGNTKRAAAAADNTRKLAGYIVKGFPASDYAARAAALVYHLDQQIPIYGSDRD